MSSTPTPHAILLQAFPGISQDEAEELLASGQVHSYPSGSVLCQEDTFEETFYIVLEGEVQVTKTFNAGEVRQLKTLGAGDFFGEMALIHDAPRAATVTTSLPTTVIEIHKAEFQNLVRHSASLALALVRGDIQRLRVNDQMAIEDLRVKAGELAAAYQQLAEQDYARREYLTDIAQQLRSPLTAASGFLQLIQSSQLPPEALHSALVSAARNIRLIVALTNELLFLQELDLILPRFVEVDLPPLASSVVTRLQAAARARRVSLNMRISPDLPPVMGDAGSLGRAIEAILDNAIKFSPQGGEVVISLEPWKKGASLAVLDQGKGIPPEALNRIFDRFFQVDQVWGFKKRGAGLGLALARQVVEQHGGRLLVESKPGQGSLFSIQLPRAQGE